MKVLFFFPMKYISITFLHDHSVTAGWREKKNPKNKKQDVSIYPHSNGFLESSLGAPRYSRDKNLAFKETASYGEEGTTEDQYTPSSALFPP